MAGAFWGTVSTHGVFQDGPGTAGTFCNGAGMAEGLWEIADTGRFSCDGPGMAGAFWGTKATTGVFWRAAGPSAETFWGWSRMNGAFQEVTGMEGIFWEGGGHSLCTEPRGLAFLLCLGMEE